MAMAHRGRARATARAPWHSLCSNRVPRGAFSSSYCSVKHEFQSNFHAHAHAHGIHDCYKSAHVRTRGHAVFVPGRGNRPRRNLDSLR